VKTGENIADTIRCYNQANVEVDVVSNPEFLGEAALSLT
jgi:UDP-glucose 6-dehydrogenase